MCCDNQLRIVVPLLDFRPRALVNRPVHVLVQGCLSGWMGEVVSGSGALTRINEQIQQI